MSQPTVNVADDPRIDPRIKALLSVMPSLEAPDVSSREELLAEAATDTARSTTATFAAIMEAVDSEEVAPSKGLRVNQHDLTSRPDGNTVNIRFIRPDNDDVLPCVYYIHGGGMQALSAHLGNYRAWGKILSAQGVAVAMIDFRNALEPSSVPEVAPFPAGLNDCVSGLEWVHANAASLASTRRESWWPARAAAATSPWRPDSNSHEMGRSI